MSEPLVEQLRREVAATGALVAAVRPDQWGGPTPCTAWSVRQLVAHLVVGHRLFAGALAGEPASGPPTLPELPDDGWPAAYQESAEAMLTGFGEPGALERPVTVPFGTIPGVVALHLRLVEALVHGWDLARATGQERPYVDEIVEQELDFTSRQLGRLPTGTRFAAPTPTADGAPPIERLAALLGREP